MKNVKSIIALMAILSMFFIGQVFAQEHNHSHKTEINVDNLGSKKLSRVDKNNDGKIFQCPMHKDQVSDNPGDCPKCGMKLKEIDVNQFNKRMMNNGKMMSLKEIKKQKDKTAEFKKEIIREGIINLSEIDKNGDGKVFQDMMDWNVISDSKGDCPVCGMHLKEVSLEEAKKNLIKNGFKVSE